MDGSSFFLLISVRMNITGPTMTEEASRFWTAVFAAITSFGLVAGGLYTIKQYFDARDKERQTYEFQVKVAQAEAKKPFFTKHLELCTDASSAAATIATTKNEKLRIKAIEDFHRLYAGPLIIVENGQLSNSMATFEGCLTGTKQGCDADTIYWLAVQIATSCRAEESANWDLGLVPVKKEPKPK